MKQFVLNSRDTYSVNASDIVYIGRPSIYGNPFSHLNDSKCIIKVSSRPEAVRSFIKWITNEVHYPELDQIHKPTLDEIRKLKGKFLKCWCAPLLCHGEWIARVANCCDEEFESLVRLCDANSRNRNQRA